MASHPTMQGLSSARDTTGGKRLAVDQQGQGSAQTRITPWRRRLVITDIFCVDVELMGARVAPSERTGSSSPRRACRSR